MLPCHNRSVLDATTAHCLPWSSANTPAFPFAAYLDIRPAIVSHPPPIFAIDVPASEASWQPCPGAIGGQAEGSEASHDRIGQLLPSGQLPVLV